MTEKLPTKAKFITIERPLLPPPPLDAEPYWCYINTLIFHDKNGKNVWEQEIPECEIYWHKNHNGIDVCDLYFYPAKVFLDKHFGWQLRLEISHTDADFWLERIMETVKDNHAKHFEKKAAESAPPVILLPPKNGSS